MKKKFLLPAIATVFGAGVCLAAWMRAEAPQPNHDVRPILEDLRRQTPAGLPVLTPEEAHGGAVSMRARGEKASAPAKDSAAHPKKGAAK